MGPGEGCLTHVCSARHILVFSFLSLCCFIPELSLESKMREIHRLPEPQGSVKRDWELSSCCWLKDFLSRHSVLKRLCSDPSVLDPAERFTEHKRTRSWHFFSLHWAASILPAARLWRPRVEVDGSRLYLRIWSQRHGIISQRHRIRSCNCQQGMAK